MSKSLSGYGLPFSLVLIKPEYDHWKPGEHNGTFRGNNHAFVTAKAAFDFYWKDGHFAASVKKKSNIVRERMEKIVNKLGKNTVTIKGRGMMMGLCFQDPDMTAAVAKACFPRGLIIETCGPDSEVLKCLCPLTISDADLNEGFDIIEKSIDVVMQNSASSVKEAN
jgi:diaminobutyrate-2-oxoglutarate transaminase